MQLSCTGRATVTALLVVGRLSTGPDATDTAARAAIDAAYRAKYAR
jgi:hypothetical protein